MTPHALQDIAKLEDTLREAADQLRASSKLTSSECGQPSQNQASTRRFTV